MSEALGIKELIEALTLTAYIPQRNSKGPFIFAVDHCFLIRGQGTVLTGTVVSGRIAVGDVSGSFSVVFNSLIRRNLTYNVFSQLKYPHFTKYGKSNQSRCLGNHKVLLFRYVIL